MTAVKHIRLWRNNTFWRSGIVGVLALLSAACISTSFKPQTIPVSQLPGWQHEDYTAVWPALLATCNSVAAREGVWQSLCVEVEMLGDVDSETARAFFETRFVARPIADDEGNTEGLITGYYEPVLSGSRTRSSR
jgi:membrane-bound lytic murein transglycosylase A